MTRRPLTSLGLVVLALTACGGSDEGDSATTIDRTVTVEMRDNRYDPTSIDIERGETIRFVFQNRGVVDHDAFIGDADAQADHEQEMGGDMGGMHHGGAGEAITVAPGEQGELTHTFDDVGPLLIGCHETGHYVSGMKITLVVS